MERIDHPDFDTLARAAAARLEDGCRAGIAARGSAALALAGGSTPLPVYRELATRALDWSAVRLMPGDERWVPADHAASNLRALRECFDGTGARFLSLVPESPGDTPGLDTARRSLEAVGAEFDACVLGMGTDGHFASLFPGTDDLAAALDPGGPDDAVIVHPDPLPAEAPYPRVSLTLGRIAASRRILLLVRGAEKRTVLERALDDADPRRLPVAALLRAAGLPLEIHWSP